MRLVNKYLKYTLLLLFAILALLIGRTVLFPSVQEVYRPSSELPAINPAAGAAERMAQATTFKTISQDPRMLDTAAFDAFGTFLRASFPRVFMQLSVDTFSTHTYVLNWPGKKTEAPKYLFIAHQDVVPVDFKSRNEWDAEAFSGSILEKDGEQWIYGRGTLDDKSAVMATLESMEGLLERGFVPENHLYFCFGQDEEIGGKAGAAVVADHYRKEGIRFEAILDEGGIISKGSIPGLEEVPVALIGTAEKGYMSVEVSFNVPGGHSSMPEKITALGQASAFVQALEGGLFEAEFSAPLEGFIEHLGPEMPFGMKLAFANRYFTQPLLLELYQKSNTGRALTNTTATATMFSSGIKDNVVPATARVVCNSRILPGRTPEEVMEAYVELATQYGGTVQAYSSEGSPATATSSTKDPAFIALGQSITTTYPGTLISPYLTIGGTDSKNFDGLARNTYRFLPIVLNVDQLAGIHGTNERISAQAYADMIKFYSRTIQAWGTL